VTDFDRARVFYETVLGITIEPMAMGPTTMGMLSSEPNAVSGALVYGAGMIPSENGTLVYLNGGDDLAPLLARVESAGGKIVAQKTEIGNDFGFYATFLDTEGNMIGFHSMG
jgi:predicted enzyme related to lactoylglutathione lyase